MRHTSLLAITLAFCCTTALANPIFFDDFKKAMDAGHVTTDLHIDNDTLMFNQRDGFYTSGVEIGRRYLLKDESASTEFGWHVGQDMYTASDIKYTPDMISDFDHPYAAWLYVGLSKNTARSDGSHIKWSVDIGCLGPCAAGEWTQTNLHRVLNQPLPQGWSTQMRNEWGAVLSANVSPLRWSVAPSFDITPNLHGRFGNIFTDAGGGVTLRIGRLNIFPEQDTLHGYLRLDASVIGYNATLQGGYFSHDNPRTVAPKRLVGESEIGVQWKHGAYSARVAVVRRTNEIKELPNGMGEQTIARFVFSHTH